MDKIKISHCHRAHSSSASTSATSTSSARSTPPAPSPSPCSASAAPATGAAPSPRAASSPPPATTCSNKPRSYPHHARPANWTCYKFPNHPSTCSCSRSSRPAAPNHGTKTRSSIRSCAAPTLTATLTRAHFDELLVLLHEGIESSRGRYGAYLLRDGVQGHLHPRRGARMIAIANGGAIPDTSALRRNSATGRVTNCHASTSTSRSTPRPAMSVLLGNNELAHPEASSPPASVLC